MVIQNAEAWKLIKMVRCDFLGYYSELSGKNSGPLIGHHIKGRKKNGNVKIRKKPHSITIWDCQIRTPEEEDEWHHKLRLPMGNNEFSFEVQKRNNAKLRKELKKAVFFNPFGYPRHVLVKIREWLRVFPRE